MSRKRRPPGPTWIVSPEWKQWALDRMDQLGITKAELSRRAKTSTAMITILFGPKTKQSALVPAINKALGAESPVQSHTDELLASIVDKWPGLSPDERRTVRDLVLVLTAKSRPADS